jgi:hypothetical protein
MNGSTHHGQPQYYTLEGPGTQETLNEFSLFGIYVDQSTYLQVIIVKSKYTTSKKKEPKHVYLILLKMYGEQLIK